MCIYIYILIYYNFAPRCRCPWSVMTFHTRLWLLANLCVTLYKSRQRPHVCLLCTEIVNTASLCIKIGFNGSTCLTLLHFKTVIIRGQIRPVLVGFAVDIVAQEQVCLPGLGFSLPVSSNQYSILIFNSSTNDIMGRVAQSVQRLSYGLDGPGSNPGVDEIFRPSRPATQPPVKWVPGLSRG